MNGTAAYHQPPPSYWPLAGSLALLALAGGFVLLLAGMRWGLYVMAGGALLLAWMLFGWFRDVVREDLAGKLNARVDLSFRWGMVWFIFSEVMLFAAFFGALFYVRSFALPMLAEAGLLWPGYQAAWPTAGPGTREPFTPMAAWGIPALNTLILLSSGATVTWAHWGLKRGRRRQAALGLAATVLLGATFLALQAHEYVIAAFDIRTGIYGATFYMLTGLHGAHVTLGAIMLAAVLLRLLAGHFTPTRHFAFEAASWYWHFVDAVWLLLFVFVYWL
jgi:cytochrome c oxidase subunit 3